MVLSYSFLKWTCLLQLLASSAIAATIERRSQSNLRILPLGDSITWGWWSSDLNGYRQDLLQMLQTVKYNVELTGYRHGGNMADNANEGLPGQTINEIHSIGFEALNGSLPLPNVVLLHAGSNDAIGTIINLPNTTDPSTVNVKAVATDMISDLKVLIDDLFVKAPQTCLILSQLIHSQDPNINKIIDAYNGYIPYLINQYVKNGKHVQGVGQANVDLNGPDKDRIWSYDPYHPGDLGYVKLASNFFLGVQAADAKGWIQAPSTPFNQAAFSPLGPIAGNPATAWALQCAYNSTWSSKTSGFTGTNTSPSSFKSAWSASNNATNGQAGNALANGFVWIIDMDGDGLPDYTWVDPGFGGLHVWYSLGGGQWSGEKTTAIGNKNTDGAGVILADMNGDGKADYLWQNTNGDITLSFAYGGTYAGQGVIASGFGGTRANTHLADLNGDGRADLIWVDSKGNVNVWLNTGGDGNVAWNKIGQVASGIGYGDKRDRFVDVNGDGRADFVKMNSDGSWNAWLNPDLTGLGAPPTFVSVNSYTPSRGVTDPAFIVIADLNGDGRADYILPQNSTGDLITYYYQGTDGYGQLRFADGNKDGLADAFLIDNGGGVSVWQNQNNSKWSTTKQSVFSGNAFGPRYTRIVDINGDGYADIVTIDPTTPNCLMHAYAGSAGFKFTDAGVISSTKPSGCHACSEIHFADRDGDGRQDLICTNTNGNSWLTYNHGTGFKTQWDFFGWILVNQNITGNQVRFGDLDGDGYDDIMEVNNQGGIRAFIQHQLSSYLGGIPNEFPDSNIPYWQVNLADVNGDARVDYLQIDPQSGATNIWYNQCPDGGFNRQPGVPRKGSPGTTLITGSASPTYTSHSNTGALAPSKTSLSFTVGPWATGTWTSVTCGMPVTVTINGSPTVTQLGKNAVNSDEAAILWQQSKADEALTDLFNGFAGSGESLTDYITSSISTLSDTQNCNDIAGDDCFSSSECGNCYNIPALCYIADAFNHVQQMYKAQAHAYDTTTLGLYGQATNWVSTFVQGKNTEGEAIDEVLTNLLTGALAIPVSRILEPIISRLGSLGDVAEGTINDGISASLSSGQDALPQPDVAKETFQIQSLVSDFFQSVNISITSGLERIFSEPGVEMLRAVVTGGHTFYLPDDISSIYNTAAQADMIGGLFQLGWNVTHTPYNYPYVMFIPYYAWNCAEGDVTKIGKVRGDDQDGSYYFLYGGQQASADGTVRVDARWCDAVGNAYILWNAGYYNSQDGYGLVEFYEFPGMNHLNGQNWSGVTPQQMVQSAFNGFYNNGLQNAGPTPQFQVDVFNPSTRVPDGFYPFPVCTSPQDAWNSIPQPPADFKPYFCGLDGSAGKTQARNAVLKNVLGYGPGVCNVAWTINDGSQPFTGTFSIYDNFQVTMLDSQAVTFDNAGDPVTLNVPLASQYPPFSLSVTISATKDKYDHETLTFSWARGTFYSYATNCHENKYDSKTKSWYGSCEFDC